MQKLYDIYKNSTGVTTDTRNIKPGNLFFALKGDKFNANQMAAAALDAGAIAAVIDEAQYAINDKCVLVEDVLTTLQNLANYHRKTFDIPVVGLTGSNGKTTNKELLARVLAKKYKVHATVGNFNNHIGVPLTLLSMPKDTQLAIIEMGANHQKEIADLCNICEPTYGFITNLGKAHLEGFGGEEGVKKGKGELFDYLKTHNGTAFVNQNDTNVWELCKEKKMMLVVYFGNDNNALELLEESPVVTFKINNDIYKTHLGGKYNFDNMLTANAVGQFFNVAQNDICEAIAEYNPTNNRSQLIEKDSNLFLMDAYNANPSSMEASINNFAQLKTSKAKMVILGDMFELGEYAESEHKKLGQQVAASNFDTVVLYGQNMQAALAYLPNAFYFTDKFSLHNWLIDKQIKDHYILIKGSRGVGLESVLTVL